SFSPASVTLTAGSAIDLDDASGVVGPSTVTLDTTANVGAVTLDITNSSGSPLSQHTLQIYTTNITGNATITNSTAATVNLGTVSIGATTLPLSGPLDGTVPFAAGKISLTGNATVNVAAGAPFNVSRVTSGPGGDTSLLTLPGAGTTNLLGLCDTSGGMS